MAKIGRPKKDNECQSSKSESSSSVLSLSSKKSFEPVAQVVVSRDEERAKSKPKQYPGSKKNEDFMGRMKLLASRQQRVTVDTSNIKMHGKSNKKRLYQTLVAQEIIDSLDCSEEMKTFIQAEFKRERKMYTFLPDNQIVNSIIHRYKTHTINSSGLGKIKIQAKNLKVKRGPSAKLKGRKKAVASVDTDDVSEAEISEFDDDDFSIPDKGSFSLSPSTSQLRVYKHVLTRFASDQESYSISDSSPEVTKRTHKRKYRKGSQTPSKRSRNRKDEDDDCVDSDQDQDLKVSPLSEEGRRPLLLSASLADNLDMFKEQEIPQPSPPVELAETIVNGSVCGSCHSSKPDILLCSNCLVIAYCDEVCQRSNWESHKMMCKRLKNGKKAARLKLIYKELGFENNNRVNGSGDKKKVTIISQPEFAPSYEEVVPMEENIVKSRSILKKGKVPVEVVLNSPTIKSLEHHIHLTREGPQEARFDKLIEGSSLEDDDICGDFQKPSSKSSLLGTLTSPGRPRSNKLSDDKFDEIMLQLERIHSSPKKLYNDVSDGAAFKEDNKDDSSNRSVTNTPANSPSLTRVVEALSSHRTTSRKSSRTRRATPFPSAEGYDELEFAVRRKIDFSTVMEDTVKEDDFTKCFARTEDHELLSSSISQAEDGNEETQESDVQRKIDFSAVAEDPESSTCFETTEDLDLLPSSDQAEDKEDLEQTSPRYVSESPESCSLSCSEVATIQVLLVVNLLFSFFNFLLLLNYLFQ